MVLGFRIALSELSAWLLLRGDCMICGQPQWLCKVLLNYLPFLSAMLVDYCLFYFIYFIFVLALFAIDQLNKLLESVLKSWPQIMHNQISLTHINSTLEKY